jgi:putative transposase
MAIRKTSHARYELWYRFAWSTKYRKKIFSYDSIKDEVKTLFREIAGHYDIEISDIEVLSDRIHFLASAPPRIAPSEVVQILKSTSTKMLFERHKWLQGYYWGGEIWVGGYFMRSAGSGLTKEAIARYIREQSEEIS